MLIAKLIWLALLFKNCFHHSVQFSHSVMSNSAISWTAAHQDPRPSPIPRCLLKLMSIESVMPSNRLILCHPFLLLPSVFPSIRVFSNESVLHISWPKCWSFSLSISPSNEYSGLIFFRTDWFDLLAVQGTTWLFNIVIHCGMISTRELLTHLSPHILTFFFFICENTSFVLLANFNYTTVLSAILTMLYIRFSHLFHLITESLCAFTSLLLFPYPKPPASTI